MTQIQNRQRYTPQRTRPGARPSSRPNQRRRRRRRRRSRVSLNTCIAFFLISLSVIVIFNLASDILNFSSDISTKKLSIATDDTNKKYLAQIPPVFDSYPNLYAITPPTPTNGEAKTVYLTFDDGPSDRTLEILDILDEYDVKATFFVTWQTSQQNRSYTIDYLNEILDRGHEIGIHTYSHDYYEIYASVDACLSDLSSIYEFVYEHTGYRATILRFAGGSYNSFNKEIYEDLIYEVNRRGFVYYDWNSSLEDASSKNYSAKQLYNNAINYFKSNTHTIVLAHDSQNETATVEALPMIIEYGLNNGFTFDKLDKSVKPIQFSN